MYFKNEERSTNNSSTFYGVDTNWYLDPSATNHIAAELNMCLPRTSIMAKIKSVLLVV